MLLLTESFGYIIFWTGESLSAPDPKLWLLERIDRPADRGLHSTIQYMVRNDVQSLRCHDNISSERYHGVTGEAGAGGHAERMVRGSPAHHRRFFSRVGDASA